MKILQISTYDIRGGAARAAYRLHRGLREIGHDCRMVVRYQDTADNSVVRIMPKPGKQNDDRGFFLDVVIQGHYINSNRTDISNTLFSLPYPGYNLSELPIVQEADVINLHWVAQYQSPLTLQKLFSLGKPVVWTLHDQWAFTGGCHYAAGCERYKSDCVGCPQLSDDPFGFPEAILKDKAVFLRNADLTIVTPSHWMAECARRSSLFRNLRIEVIANSLETDIYAPVPKQKAKERLGLEGDMVTLLFGGEDGNEKRKGFKELMDAVRHCLKNERFRDLVHARRLTLICFGHPHDAIASLKIPVKLLGYLDTEEKIRNAYACADVFVLPSLEDNLPNTVLEAMSCATPVVAFDIGGIPEMIQSGVNGQLAPLGDAKNLGEALLSLILNPEKREAMGRACRKKIEAEYPLNVQAQAYLELYREIIYQNETSGPFRSSSCGKYGWEVVSNGFRPMVLSVPRDYAVGPHFGTIYNQVLNKALTELSPKIHEKLMNSEADRKTRYDQIKELTNRLRESELDRRARFDQVQELTDRLRESEFDRKARFDQVQELTDRLRESELDRKARFDQITELTDRLRERESDQKAMPDQLQGLKDQLREIELDRNARFDQVQELTERLRESELDRNAMLDQVQGLKDQLREIESDQNAMLDRLQELTERLKQSEWSRKKMLDQVNSLNHQIDHTRDFADVFHAEKVGWKNEMHGLDEWQDIPKEERELAGLSRSRSFEALEKEIAKIEYEIEYANLKVGTAEKGLRDLESTFVVRQARKWGLINIEPHRMADSDRVRREEKKRKRIIAVDMTPLLPGGENGGAKVFTIELLKSLQRNIPGDHFLLLTASWNHEELAILDSPNMSRLYVLKGKRKGKLSFMVQLPGRLWRRLDKISRTMGRFSKNVIATQGMLRSLGVDLLFCPFTAPTYAEPGIPTVSVIYDLQHIDLQHFFSRHEIEVRNGFMKEVSDRADHIVCISHHVRETVLKNLKTDERRTHAVHICIQSRFSVPDEKTVEVERSRLGIAHRPYMFYPANFWPHKNHRMLLTAYGMFLSRNPDSPLDLVFTGALDNLEKEMKRVVERMGLKERVHFLGFLAQGQFEVVWQGCEFLIFPSLYEGFGIPVLEAMAIGKPVLCSNTTSLPEIAGEAALYFDPRKPADIVNCLGRVTCDVQLKRELIERGLIRSKGFSLEKMIDTYTKIFTSALQGPFSSSGYVSGIFNDGWIGDKMAINFGPGPRNRSLKVHVSAPSWLPSAWIKLRLRDHSRLVKKMKVPRGQEVTISLPLAEDAGRLNLIVTPTFRPSKCKMGEDDRVLGIKYMGCWMVYPDQGTVALPKAGEKCV